MLVVTRKLGQAIVIPSLGVSLTILSFRGKSVRVGIEAPKDAVILREELLDAKGHNDDKPKVSLLRPRDDSSGGD